MSLYSVGTFVKPGNAGAVVGEGSVAAGAELSPVSSG